MLLLGVDDLLDEAGCVDASMRDRVDRLCRNNSYLSSNYRLATFQRPLIDRLSEKLSINSTIKMPMYSSSAHSKDNAVSSTNYRQTTINGDGERRYFLKEKKMASLRPSIISKLRKLQQKVSAQFIIFISCKRPNYSLKLL